MQLPFVLVVEPPTRAELSALLQRRVWRWGLVAAVAVGLLAALYGATSSGAAGAVEPESVPLTVVSRPAGARVFLNGSEVGRTPASLTARPGTNSLSVRHPAYLDADRELTVVSAGALEPEPELAIDLWRRQPSVRRLRPAVPGATLAGAEFLADGRVALVATLPAGAERQAWLLDPVTGDVERLFTPGASRGIAVSADGQQVAFLADAAASTPGERPNQSAGAISQPGGGAGRRNAVWVARAGSAAAPRSIGALPGTQAGHAMIDVAWSPGGSLLAVSADAREAVGRQLHMWRVDMPGHAVPASIHPSGGEPEADNRPHAPGGEPEADNRPHALEGASADRAAAAGRLGATPRLLATLPREVELVPASYAWSPDGQRVAFLVQAGELSALCLLDTQREDSLAYLADLAPGSRSTVAFAPLSWSADGQRMAFVAPPSQAPWTPRSWLDTRPKLALFVPETSSSRRDALGEAPGEAPAWSADGRSLLVLASADERLVLRGFEPTTGATSELLSIPLRVSSGFQARWDVAHGQVLVATAGRGGAPEFWLIRFTDEAGA